MCACLYGVRRGAMNRPASRRGGKNSTRVPTPLQKNEIKLDTFCVIDEDIFCANNRTQNCKANRSCFVAPETQDFSNFADDGGAVDGRVCKLQDEMFEALFGPYANKIPNKVTRQKDLKSLICSSGIETRSQSLNAEAAVDVSTCTSTRWAKPDDTGQAQLDIDRKPEKQRYNTTPPQVNIKFSETPRVKVIAEKFYKFKKNDIELRKLEEKVVCIEYDVFDEDCMNKPLQTMRAYFSVRPIPKNGVEGDITTDQINHIKQKLELPEDGMNPTKNEIEMIDGQISQNQSYLDDLKLVLQRHKANEQHKQKSYLDLKSLYEMATNQPNLGGGICKEQLNKAKELILTKFNSGVHGVTRRMVHSPSFRNRIYEPSAVTKSILNVMLSELGEV